MAGKAGIAGTAGQPTLRSQQPTGAPPRAGVERLDEPLGGPERAEFKPSGTGGEFSTSQQSFQEIVDFQPSRNATLLLEEVALSVESNGEAKVSVGGDVYGGFTGATDVSLPFDGAKLPFGGHVRVFHQSTDGTSTTTKVSVTAKEV